MSLARPQTRPSDSAARQPSLGDGQGLDPRVRARVERVSHRAVPAVRVHTGGPADDIARSHGVRAWAYGQDVGFRAGEYRPGSLVSDAILAHEVIHTMQQDADGPSEADVGSLEQEATSFGLAATLGDPRLVEGRRAPGRSSGLRLAGCGGGSEPAAPIDHVSRFVDESDPQRMLDLVADLSPADLTAVSTLR